MSSLHDKYKVHRIDGLNDFNPRYFVLNYAKDLHARVAVEAYAASCESGSPELAKELREELEATDLKIYVVVTLFKPNGSYSASEQWRIPNNATGPWDMRNSPDFRRIDGGSVLIESQEPWGFPHLIPGER